MKYCLSLCLVFFVSFYGFSQKIKGTVLDETGAPVMFANLVWKGTNMGTTTNETGNFAIQKPDQLPAFLIISCMGFQTDTIKVWPNMKRVEAQLKSNVVLNEMEVTARSKSTTLSTLTSQQLETLGQKELDKAACCTVSESFETNASVDVNVTDAVSGSKRIKMLGLDGIYTQIQVENMPLVRGGSAANGLNFIPGTWVSSIQIKKGAGSVINGYESIAGQINIEIFKPDAAPKLFLNAYVNQMGRLEVNVQGAKIINEKLSTSLYVHGSGLITENDRNKDQFLDVPQRKTLNVLNRWKYAHKNLRAQIFVRALLDDLNAGQLEKVKNRYEVNVSTRQLYAFTKTGFILPSDNSIGLSLKVKNHVQESNYGNTQYNLTHNNFYASGVYYDEWKEVNGIFKTGVSLNYDQYNHVFNDSLFDNTEIVPGAFVEYAYTAGKLSLVGGLRGDFHNQFGFFTTPRLHAKYALFDRSALRFSAGRGQRTANALIENASYLVSARKVILATDLTPEVAWNYGASFTQNVDVKEWELAVSLDYYYTNFENQVVADVENARQVSFYNLNGKSFSHALQAELSATRGQFDMKFAYKYLDVQTTFGNELKQTPYIIKHRGLVNMAYATRFDKWKFDLTTLLNGLSRVPSTKENPAELQRSTTSKAYWVVNGQINRKFRTFDMYLGVENLFDYKQENPIIDSENPFGSYFDASMIWGPIAGRNIYVGFKMKIE